MTAGDALSALLLDVSLTVPRDVAKIAAMLSAWLFVALPKVCEFATVPSDIDSFCVGDSVSSVQAVTANAAASGMNLKNFISRAKKLFVNKTRFLRYRIAKLFYLSKTTSNCVSFFRMGKDCLR